MNDELSKRLEAEAHAEWRALPGAMSAYPTPFWLENNAKWQAARRLEALERVGAALFLLVMDSECSWEMKGKANELWKQAGIRRTTTKAEATS